MILSSPFAACPGDPEPGERGFGGGGESPDPGFPGPGSFAVSPDGPEFSTGGSLLSTRVRRKPEAEEIFHQQ